MPKKARAPKKKNCALEFGNRNEVVPPKKPPDQIVKNSCSGSCINSAIHPIKTGLNENNIVQSPSIKCENVTVYGRQFNAGVTASRPQAPDRSCPRRLHVHPFATKSRRRGRALDPRGQPLALYVL